MKKCLVSHLLLGFFVVALPLLGGCTRQSAGGSNPFVSSASAEPVTGENNLAAVTEAVTNSPVATAEAITSLGTDTNTTTASPTNASAPVATAASDVVPPTEQKPPANVRLSPVLSEAVKLAQAGVDQSVLLTYITNTTGYFALGAEEIVYLNDLGVAGNVITTMMQHDQALRELRSNAWQTAQAAASNQATQQPVQAEPEIAAAPTYVEAPALEAEPAYVSNNYFDDSLSPYGSWVYVSGYGRCWRPTVAICNPGWRPYCDRGRWVHSDCGWYWLSDYSWGSTAFHYGRWFNQPNVGWCWWPDTVWAPSWVSWRYTSDYCGWAPLPPSTCYQSGFGLVYNNGSVGVSFGFGLGVSSYAFVPWGNFCGPRPYQYCVPATRSAYVYNQSRPYNHWEGGGQGRAYNRGLAPERVRELSRTEVRTVSIQDQSSKSPRAERLEVDGRTLAVRRPQFTATPTDVANISSGGGIRTGSRPTLAPRTGEAVVPTAPQSPTSPVTAPSGRVEINGQPREQRTANRQAGQAVPVVSGVTKVESKPTVPTPPRVENRAGRNGEVETASRTRTTSPVVARPTQQPVNRPVTTVPTPVSTEAQTSPSRGVQPVGQVTPRPAAPAQRSSIIVIGGGNNTRSGGRDYSVWNTPSQSPTPSPVPNNVSTRTTPATPVNNLESADTSSAPVVRAPNGNGQNRGNYNRPDNRGAYQTYSTPQAGQAVPPTANYNARPVQSEPTANYVPRSQPSTAPNAARTESRSAPARTSVPATSQSGQNQGRPNR